MSIIDDPMLLFSGIYFDAFVDAFIEYKRPIVIKYLIGQINVIDNYIKLFKDTLHDETVEALKLKSMLNDIEDNINDYEIKVDTFSYVFDNEGLELNKDIVSLYRELLSGFKIKVSDLIELRKNNKEE